MWPRRQTIRDWGTAILLWGALGFSLGWYYTITYFGGRGSPLPSPESLYGLIVYYFSVLNANTTVQALHWMAVFPLSGILWVSVLSFTSPYFEGRRAHFSYTLFRFGLATLPLSVPGPAMAYLAGNKGHGFEWARMVAVALRREGMTGWPWLTPLYVGLAVGALGLQIYFYRIAFDIRGKKAWAHFLTAAILMTLIAAGLGTLTAIPLRALLE